MPVFERCPPDAIPTNCVVVNVWRAMGRTVADVACTTSPKAGELMVADFPRPVPVALQRAQEVREYCGLKRIVVVLDDDNLWKPSWGELRSLGAVN